MPNSIAKQCSPDNYQTLMAVEVRVRGIVQGVGFRPTVWKIAKQLGLTGHVLNDGDGVLILLQGNQFSIESFEKILLEQCPPLATIESIEIKVLNVNTGLLSFDIIQSEHKTNTTGVSADAAICEDCLRDIRDPENRRFLYPFTNCTNCGPRFSIIRAIPYDRPNTSMSAFHMCPDCLAEYEDPADRRFHAQPNACKNCGPNVWLETNDGKVGSDKAIEEAAHLLRRGKILAIKGIGGFHLACDANNEQAINTLRLRKHRPDKALAIMARSVEEVRRYCNVDKSEAKALESSAAPIVVLDRNTNNSLPDTLAPGISQLGFMLPYSPLHALLIDCVGFPVVLTSGNISEEPQCVSNTQARERLAEIADAFLMHDREIINRVDDSVVRKMDGEMRTLRRARGLAPGALSLPDGFASKSAILAYGAELKNTFCLLQDNHAMLSQHMGDLENAGIWQDYEYNIDLSAKLYESAVKHHAVDAHPEYLSSKFGREAAQQEESTISEIQHHHAHIAAVLADNGIPLESEAVIGIALDGLGYGHGDALWGGEIFLADYQQCRRIASLKPVAMPGGAQAIKQPWRNTYAHLGRSARWLSFRENNPNLPFVRLLVSKPTVSLDQMIANNINCPLTSSCGRLFDAVAGALGISANSVSYEGQAAIELEALTSGHTIDEIAPYRFNLVDGDLVQIDPEPMWNELLIDLENNIPEGIIASRFHSGLAAVIVSACCRISKNYQIKRVALGGGVFQNKTLLELLADGLREKSFTVYQARQIPCNDSSIAFGQAIIAAAMDSSATLSTEKYN